MFKCLNLFQAVSSRKLIMTTCVGLIVLIAANFKDRLLKDPKDLTCYYDVNGGALNSAGVGLTPPQGTIFFHETSCKGGLNLRQACSVESAARIHPERAVYVLFNAPVSHHDLEDTILATLKEIPNIHFARVEIEDYAKGTPLEPLVKKKVLLKTCSMEYVSYLLRFLTLRKWGGIYLDLDMIVSKNLGPLGVNWIACEDHRRVNSAAIAISHNGVGRQISNDIIREMAKEFDPKKCCWNKSNAVMKVLRKRCSRPDVYEWSNRICKGFQVWAPSFVFPIHYSFSEEYFKVNATMGDIMTMSTYAYHLWNHKTHNLKAAKDTLYDNLAKELCPEVYSSPFSKEY